MPVSLDVWRLSSIEEVPRISNQPAVIDGGLFRARVFFNRGDITVCEMCEWENAMPYNVDAVLEKWQDALDCADDWTEKNLVQEFIEDLIALKARA